MQLGQNSRPGMYSTSVLLYCIHIYAVLFDRFIDFLRFLQNISASDPFLFAMAPSLLGFSASPRLTLKVACATLFFWTLLDALTLSMSKNLSHTLIRFLHLQIWRSTCDHMQPADTLHAAWHCQCSLQVDEFGLHRKNWTFTLVSSKIL